MNLDGRGSRAVRIDAGVMMASAAGRPASLRANGAEQPTIVVTAPAGALERNEAISVEADAIRGSGKPDLFDALERAVPGLSLQEAQNNPYQPTSSIAVHGLAPPRAGTGAGGVS